MRRNILVAVIIFLLALLASSVAWADGRHRGHGHGFSHHGFKHHGHRHHGHPRARLELHFGVPYSGSWYYRPYPRYYAQPQYYVYAYPPVAPIQSGPPVYIERGDQGNEVQPPAAYWYYCQNPQGYYPNVRVCPQGWQQVPAQPSSAP